MKILIDARLYGLENAGLGRYSINLIDQLSRIDTQNQYVILLRKKYFKTLELPSNWKKVLADFHHYGFKEQILIPLIIKKEKPDLTHFLHFNVPLFAAGRFIVTIHDLLMHKNKGLEATTLSVPMYFLKRLAYSTVFKSAVTKSEKIIVPTKTIKRELVTYYKVNAEKVLPVYEGFDRKISTKERFAFENPYFVYTGNAYPHKNLDRLIKATLLLNESLSQKVNLVIASSRNIFTNRLQKNINTMNAGNFVKLLGFVPDEKLGSLYKNSVAFIFPSLSEGFGLPGLEAMSSGTVVLSSEISVFKEVYKDKVFYFNPLDVVSISKAMKTALSLNQKRRQEIIEKGKRFVSIYSWEKMAMETLGIYKSTK